MIHGTKGPQPGSVPDLPDEIVRVACTRLTQAMEWGEFGMDAEALALTLFHLGNGLGLTRQPILRPTKAAAQLGDMQVIETAEDRALALEVAAFRLALSIHEHRNAWHDVVCSSPGFDLYLSVPKQALAGMEMRLLHGCEWSMQLTTPWTFVSTLLQRWPMLGMDPARWRASHIRSELCSQVRHALHHPRYTWHIPPHALAVMAITQMRDTLGAAQAWWRPLSAAFPMYPSARMYADTMLVLMAGCHQTATSFGRPRTATPMKSNAAVDSPLSLTPVPLAPAACRSKRRRVTTSKHQVLVACGTAASSLPPPSATQAQQREPGNLLRATQALTKIIEGWMLRSETASTTSEASSDSEWTREDGMSV